MSEDKVKYKRNKPKLKCKYCGADEFIIRGLDLCLKCKSEPRINRDGRLVIGLDPDTKKSGLGAYDIIEKKFITVKSYSFFEIFELFRDNKSIIRQVKIEAGWLERKGNFHHVYGQTKVAGERIAKDVGSNHETGRKLAELCEYLDIPYVLIKPLGTKNIDAKKFKKLTGWTKQTNQDNRDAAMLCYR